MSRRPLSDFLVWIPAAFYAVSFVVGLTSPSRPPLADAIFPALAFALIAAAYVAQSKRLLRLEARDRAGASAAAR